MRRISQHVYKRVFLLLYGVFLILGVSYAQSNEDCMMCHEDPELVTERNGKSISLFVNQATIGHSVHKDVDCTACHEDADVEEFPHPENLKPVSCMSCHPNAQEQFDNGIHGKVLSQNGLYAPTCKECHGKHDILSSALPESRTYKMNIPLLCGSCHKEGSPVARTYSISEHNILENYSQGIHGRGLYEAGLIVTATCNDCHGNHLILPSKDRNSSVSPGKIAATCMKCHIRIEQTHKKVIKSELWEKKPGDIPSCTSCHPPHKVEYEKEKETISNKVCLDCHHPNDANAKPMIKSNGDTIHFNNNHLPNSVHYNIQCVECHTTVTAKMKRPCTTVESVDCSNCHIKTSNEYYDSGHGRAFVGKNPNAPYCTDCHGTHQTKSKVDESSTTYRGAIPQLCGSCHTESGKANIGTDLKEMSAYSDYSHSTHGKGLTEKGLLVSAVCTDCHTSHHELKESDTLSSVNPKNVALTCAQCHKSIYNEYISSEHSLAQNKEGVVYPTCSTCHSAHEISDIKGNKFMNEITFQCGSCHEKLSETYRETYHGKAYLLGDQKAARCSDCHGAHHILSVDNPNSAVGYKNIVETCQQCHANANLAFTGYLTHATHNDNKVLFYSFWGMTSLLILVFSFFGFHTLIWLPRSLKQRKINKHKHVIGKTKYYRRFNVKQQTTHIFVIISFIMLALTGMTLKFAHMEWAASIAKFLGGVHSAGIIHRFGAFMTFGYFAFHVYNLILLKKKNKASLKSFIFGKDSIMFNVQDWKDLVASIKWFFGKGPRPQYGRWTYWEKFDYFAVFWGVAVIGLSGLILWFPEFFTLFMPGWAINVAQIIHSDEALLAVGFIFTVHFFNTHLRPESFPMDTVIFTGYVPLEEYKKDRPREYEELVSSGKIDQVVVEKELSTSWIKTVKFFGYLFLFTGITIVILIVYSMIAGVY
ncbi:MAG: hypothetical protein JW729_06495 [Bacteroidales bacterium]|nr:hypothetical protein [Bacteroidales bacterium]